MSIEIPQQDLDDLSELARSRVIEAQLPELFVRLAPGPYGLSEGHLRLFRALERGLTAIIAVRRALEGRIIADRRSGFASDGLTESEERFCSLFSVSVGFQEAVALLELGLETLPAAERHLKLSEYRGLLTSAEKQLLPKLLADLRGYLGFYHKHSNIDLRPKDDERLTACVGSYLKLVAQTAERLGDDGEYAPLLEALAEKGLRFSGTEYRGFSLRRNIALPDDESGLLPISPEDIVGNQEVLASAISLCRAVAGFDLDRGQNPQMVRNPVIFVLGAPGCGKTVTAHAVGNYFLKLCRENGIPAKFRIIRRTDWASHYQNKSANELLRIFREEIFEFPGVAGVYWPDIDTAFAARSDPGIRGEEKGLLGTMFGLLDGTVGPRNGKWFLIADANYLTMDEAMLSRLAQDPHRAQGPQSAQDFITLLRDKKLARVRHHLKISGQQWQTFGERCLEQKLSGRAVDNLAGRILAMIEDVQVPDEYFSMSYEQKEELLEQHRRDIQWDQLGQLVQRYVDFERDAEEKARRERFERRVDEIREHLAAQVVAAGSLSRE